MPIPSHDASNRKSILKKDQCLLTKFVMLKALELNWAQCGKTGHIGGIILGTLLQHDPRFGDNEYAEEADNFAYDLGYAITSLPGKIFGFFTSPLRYATMYSRKVLYTNAEVTSFADFLNKLPRTKYLQLENAISEILQYKESCRTSDSSHNLILFLRGNHSTKEKAIAIGKYLRETEKLALSEKQWMKNQGKLLLNTIMQCLEKHQVTYYDYKLTRSSHQIAKALRH